jgi:hypothetical protein
MLGQHSVSFALPPVGGWQISKTYPTPTHAKAFVKGHRTLVYEDSLDAVHNAVQLPILIRHQAHFHDIWQGATGQSQNHKENCAKEETDRWGWT